MFAAAKKANEITGIIRTLLILIWSVSAYFANHWYAHSWNMEWNMSGLLIK